jgi:beta-galactosidase/beta-glucuronidase
MQDVHSIRLAGPWRLEPTGRFLPADGGFPRLVAVDLPEAQTAKMPADWSAVCGPGYSGQVRYTRRFHKPQGLQEGEVVWLVVEPARSRAEVWLNGQRLGELSVVDSRLRVDVTKLLVDFNELVIVVSHPAVDNSVDSPTSAVHDVPGRQPGGLVGEVRLEIGFP